MKNTIIIIYTTIISILFITVLFTIAELNIIAKTEFTNHLEQSVIMTASYLIICKLLIQMAITYIAGNMLYRKIKYIHDSNINYNSVKESWESAVGVKSETNNTPNIIKPILWEKYPERMKHHIDRQEDIRDWLKQEPLTPNEAFKPNTIKYDGQDYKLNATSQQPNMEIFDKVSELKFDPIDQIDELDKNGIGNKPSTRKFKDNKVKDVLNKVENEHIGTRLGTLLTGIPSRFHTFKIEQVRANNIWKQVYDIDKLDVGSYEIIVINKKNHYYVEVK